ncbi:hypothetical protein [Streptomyces qinglanensis]|uniref:hypothetical protein n=1 Tax=Streptomyces qinglanensis TaxID=943816 RepID=UPI0013A6C4BA|nr:hypothetical protein [Streptomyces qinglanensis]
MTETTAPELPGMPEPAVLRRVEADGKCLVSRGGSVLFVYDAADRGMRNLAVVAVTDAGVAVQEAAVAFGLTPQYVSMLRGRARRDGSAGLVKPMGRRPKLTARQVEQAGGGPVRDGPRNRSRCDWTSTVPRSACCSPGTAR